MRSYNALKCTNVSPSQFAGLADLLLTTATAYQLIPDYPVVFGLDDEGIGDSPIIIENDQEFSVLADWEGRILTLGFDD